MRNRWRRERFFGMVRASEGSLHRRFLILAAAASFVIALGAPGCSGQGEGERCDTQDDNAGDSDCADGLECWSYSYLGGQAAVWQQDICCPTNLTQSTTAICELAPSPPGGNEGLPDSSTDTGASSEAGPDSRADAPLDSPNDSPVDSPDSSGD
jgi:hypothetical protein